MPPVLFDPVSKKVIWDDTEKKVQALSIYGDDCCCFMDPSLDYDPEKTYAKDEYAYGDNFLIPGPYGLGPEVTYQSLQDNNTGHLPLSCGGDWQNNHDYVIGDYLREYPYHCWENKLYRCIAPFNSGTNDYSKYLSNGTYWVEETGWWAAVSFVRACGNENWNAYPPFGGVGKSPKYLKVTFSGVSTNPAGQCLNESEESDCETNRTKFNPNQSFILIGGNCTWSCAGSVYPKWQIIVFLGREIFLTLHNTEAEEGDYCQYFIANSDWVCSDGRNGWGMGGEGENSGEWISTTTYNPSPPYGYTEGDRVTRNGVAYRNIQENNQGHDPASSPSWWSTDLQSNLFKVNTIVQSAHSSNIYRCKQDHTSSPFNEPEVGANWESYWELEKCFNMITKPTRNVCNTSCVGRNGGENTLVAIDGTVTMEFLTTLPNVTLGIATAPDPTDEATNKAANTQLNWTPGINATYQNIYFGTTNPPPLVARVLGDVGTYNPGTLAYSTPYYWRIDSGIDSCAIGTKEVEGEVWTFTTMAEPNTTPPTPNPMTWNTTPHKDGSNHHMIASVATDADNPPVEYSFEGSGGGVSSGWISSNNYSVAGGAYGAYRVRARDALGNMTGYSPKYGTDGYPVP
jgi:hypothetical protein